MSARRPAALAGLLGLAAGCRALVPAPGPPDPPAGDRDRSAPPVVAESSVLRDDERGPAPSVADRRGQGPIVRVALATAARQALVGADGDWQVLDDGGGLVASVRGAGAWQAEHRPGAQRLVRADRTPVGPWTPRPLVVRALGGARVTLDGRPYRGDLRLVPTDSGLVVVNRVALEDYLRGVVPREIGPRTADERAAVEAQAIASRSYAAARLRGAPARTWDVVGGVLSQVYGGVEGETPVASRAVEATAGLVLWHRGTMIDAPFHSACGGRTAEAPEVWRTGGSPWLRSVDDTDPATGRPWCERAPRFAWTIRFGASALEALAARWLAQYGGAPSGHIGPVSDVRIRSRTPSGRVAEVAFETARGTYVVRANDVRFVLRQPTGEYLNSTAFELVPESGGGVEVRGRGYGHGVGMCQWGAIGRARAGHDARAILRAYFPGTSVGAMPAGAE